MDLVRRQEFPRDSAGARRQKLKGTKIGESKTISLYLLDDYARLSPVVELARRVLSSEGEENTVSPSEDTGAPDDVTSAPAEAAKNAASGSVPEDRIFPRGAVTVSNFLAAFYPDPGEEIRLRFFAPRGVPEDGRGRPSEPRFSPVKRGVTLARLCSDAALRRELAALNSSRGAYFTVNAGGDKDTEITRFNAFFAECDDGTLAEQHAKFDACPLPPAIRIETRKSVHAYWLAAPGVGCEEWRAVQAGLIRHFGSDPRIKNPSRVMRLPHFNHLTYNSGLLDTKRVRVAAFDTSRRLTAAEMLAAFPPPLGKKPKPQHVRRPAPVADLAGDSLEHLKRELGRRVMEHPSAHKNGSGKWDCRALCHDGKGTTGLFYDPAENFVWCNREPYCDLQTIAAAFGVSFDASREGGEL